MPSGPHAHPALCMHAGLTSVLKWLRREFGGVSYALGCVPVLSWLLEFSSSVGAALWAADMEKSGHIRLL